MSKLGSVFYLNGLTLIYGVRIFPKRVMRIVLHFIQWVPAIRKIHLRSKNLQEWISDFCFYFVDVLFVPELFELSLVWFRPNTRLLSKKEKLYARKYLGESIDLGNTRICNRMYGRIQDLAIAFVTFNTIHYSEKISKPVYIHELVHIWQNQKFGSVYIYRALKAQRSKEGYNYGGAENLYAKMLDSSVFTDFNFEQQGAIFEDYVTIVESDVEFNPIAEASYSYFIGQLQGAKAS
ncbi:MAG: hypothetical protein AAGA77_15825 [Bacteroidota bacterium]